MYIRISNLSLNSGKLVKFKCDNSKDKSSLKCDYVPHSLCFVIFSLMQLKQFERLEQEVSQPINHDLTGWTPAGQHPQAPRSNLSTGDRQLLLFYAEQCESNITTLTNIVDAFFNSVGVGGVPVDILGGKRGVNLGHVLAHRDVSVRCMAVNTGRWEDGNHLGNDLSYPYMGVRGVSVNV